MSDLTPAFKTIGTRLANGEEAFVAVLMGIAAITREEGFYALKGLRKAKAIAKVSADGRVNVKHGAFLERDVILRAVELGKS